MTNRRTRLARPLLLTLLGITLYSQKLTVYADETAVDTAAEHTEGTAQETAVQDNIHISEANQNPATIASEAPAPIQATQAPSEPADTTTVHATQSSDSDQIAPLPQDGGAQTEPTPAKDSAPAPIVSAIGSGAPEHPVQSTSAAIQKFSADKASYRPGETVNLGLTFSNPTAKTQTITASIQLNDREKQLGSPLKTSKYLAPGESYTTRPGELSIPGSSLDNNHGYLLSVQLADSSGRLLEQTNRALAIESDWTTFPRYGVVGGSGPSSNSILAKDLPTYSRELDQMKNMNINSYFFYDAYKSATDPFPNVPKFDQTWNWWSRPQIETGAVKNLVSQIHDTGATAMLYNMALAQNVNEASVLPETEYVLNYDAGGFGRNGKVMTYSIKNRPLQRYYSPLSESWQNYITKAMKEAMDNGGFDGWQIDTIGDNRVLDYSSRHSSDPTQAFMLSDAYGQFIDKAKEKLPNYYLTLNDINGENIHKLAASKQDVIYNELWPFGPSAINGRLQNTYGDLKARIDQVRQTTGKSLIVGAYMEEPKFDDSGSTRIPLNGAARDALALRTYQTDAVLLTTAAIAAAGGYHMSLASLANPNANGGVGVLETAYYPTQSLRVSDELNRKNYNYQQFITAYENILRDRTENDTAVPQTFSAGGQRLSTDPLGVRGNQVWTYAKKGPDFRTIQLLNHIGITPDWKNEDGYENNKTPVEQTNLLVTYPLGNVSLQEANRLAKQVYLTSPDDWLKSSMVLVNASVALDSKGEPVLEIQVPRLTLWDMIYIPQTVSSALPQPQPKSEPESTVPRPGKGSNQPQKSADPALQISDSRITTDLQPVQTSRQAQIRNRTTVRRQETAKKRRSAKPLPEALPQTGEQFSLLKAVGAGILLAGVAGLISLKRRTK